MFLFSRALRLLCGFWPKLCVRRLVFVRLLFLSYPWFSLGSLAIEGVATCALSLSPKQEGWPKASTTYISLTLKKHLPWDGCLSPGVWGGGRRHPFGFDYHL